MNKKLAFIGFLTAILMAPVFGQTPKMATVSMQRLFDGYYKKQEAFDRLNSVQRQAQEEMEERAAPLRELESRLEDIQERAQNQLLSDDARRDLEEEFNTLATQLRRRAGEFQQWQQQKVGELQQRQQQIRMNLIEEIRDVVLSVAREQGVDMVFDTSDVTGSGVPAVLYAASSLDMTDRVMRELNRNAPQG